MKGAERRDLFHRYLDARLKTYSNVDDQEMTEAMISETAKLQDIICQQIGYRATALL